MLVGQLVSSPQGRYECAFAGDFLLQGRLRRWFWQLDSSRKEVPSQKEYAYASELLVAFDFPLQGRHECLYGTLIHHKREV